MSTHYATTFYDFEVWTTTGRVVVTDPDALEAATGIVHAGLEEVEHACSRFRPDSELRRLTGRAGRGGQDGPNPSPHEASPTLAHLFGTPRGAPEATHALLDPPVGYHDL